MPERAWLFLQPSKDTWEAISWPSADPESAGARILDGPASRSVGDTFPQSVKYQDRGALSQQPKQAVPLATDLESLQVMLLNQTRCEKQWGTALLLGTMMMSQTMPRNPRRTHNGHNMGILPTDEDQNVECTAKTTGWQ